MDKNNIVCRTAKSGIRIVGEVIPNAYSVSLGVWVKAGPVYETDKERGISHFIEHMLFKGTAKRDAKTLASEIDAVGGSINAFTAKEYTCYYTRTLGEDIELAVDVLLDMVCNPLLSQSDIENEKGVVCEEILMGEDDPEDVVHETLCSTIYRGSPLAFPILGTIESVNGITREAIISYMQRRYVPENIVIACAGAFDMDKLVALADERYRAVQSSGTEPEKEVFSTYVKDKNFKFVKKDIEQAHICLSFPSAKFNDELSMPMSIVNNAFGGAASSRLFQRIREDRGLAYSVYSVNSAYSTTGYWTIYAGTAEGRTLEVVECMLDELKLLKKDGLTEEEFLRGKSQLRRGFLLGLETVSVHSNAIGKDMLCLGRVRYDEELLERLERVTREDVMNAVKKVVDTDFMCGVVVSRGKCESQADELRNLIMNTDF